MDFSFIKKITDFIMPLEPIEEEEQEEEPVEKKTKAPKKPAASENVAPVQQTSTTQQSPISNIESQYEMGKMRTAEGGSVAFGGMKYTAYAMKEEPVMRVKPQLTVVKGSGMSVKIHKPTKFEEVRTIADDLLGNNVVIVNYEMVDEGGQRKINDFVNGVCYVTDGHVDQISERIVLYTPEGIDAEAALARYAMR
jgi:cell division inhibitor SepF